MMLFCVLLILSIMKNNVIIGHSFYRGQCPQFTPMDNFDWNKVLEIFFCFEFAVAVITS